MQSAMSDLHMHIASDTRIVYTHRGVRGVVLGATLLLVTPLAHGEPEGDAEPPTEAHAESDAPSRGLAPGLKLSLSVEPGVALALTDPQAQRTSAGFGQTLKLLFGVTRYLAIGP